MMQGRQKIKDIVAALTDTEEIDHQSRTEMLHKTLKTLLDQQYLRTVNWWNLMPNDDLLNKITLEEEKRLRGGDTTSASMSSKTMKEAAAESERRIKELKSDDKTMEGLKRKADEMIDVATHLRGKRLKRVHEMDEAEEEIKLDVDVINLSHLC
jgi:RNA polymerase III subunit RPC82